MDHEAYWHAVEFIECLDRRYLDNQGVGWVYAVRNREFKRPLIKIGMSQNPPHVRARQLASTGVPGFFQLIYCVHSVDALGCEQLVHERLAEHRFQPEKEFFLASIGQVVAAMDLTAGTLPIRRSQGRSGRYNERSKPLPQPFQPVVVPCPDCGQPNRVRPLAIEVTATCGRCGVALPTLSGLGSATAPVTRAEEPHAEERWKVVRR